MNTIIKTAEDPTAIPEAAEILKRGGLVAFPTETVYGLGADALDATASSRIYAAKGRPSDNPLIVHIAEKKAVYELAVEVPETAVLLMEAFWPGPLTIILKKKEMVPDATTGGLPTVAIRMPSHPAAMEMIRRSGVYVAAPSANRSGRPSPTTAQHVKEDLDGVIEMILDGGPVGIGIESTIVDLSEGSPMILRPGFITKEMLEAVIGEVKLDPSLEENIVPAGEETGSALAGRDTGSAPVESDVGPVLTGKDGGSAPAERNTGSTPAGSDGVAAPARTFDGSVRPDLGMRLRPKAPGMRYTHYAPRGELSIVSDRDHPECVTAAVSKKIGELAGAALAEGKSTAVLTTGENAAEYDWFRVDPHFHLILLGDTDDGQTVAAHLYAALRTCDDLGCEVIYSENFRRDALGSAIMNRLIKAAGHRVILV